MGKNPARKFVNPETREAANLADNQNCSGRKQLKDGAGDRDRTGDIQLGKLAFYR
jgi:hypothetical protein